MASLTGTPAHIVADGTLEFDWSGGEGNLIISGDMGGGSFQAAFNPLGYVDTDSAPIFQDLADAVFDTAVDKTFKKGPGRFRLTFTGSSGADVRVSCGAVIGKAAGR